MDIQNKRIPDDVSVYGQQVRQGSRGQGIVQIVFSGHLQGELPQGPSFPLKAETGAPILVVGGLKGMVVAGGTAAESDYGAFQPLGDFLQMRNLPVDNQTAVGRQQLCIAAEGMAYVVKVFKEVQVVLINVQDHADSGGEA